MTLSASPGDARLDVAGPVPPADRRWNVPRLGLLAIVPAFLSLAAGVDVWYYGVGGNSIDPFIYVGVVDRLHDYLDRWPRGYYVYRFGYLLPEWLFEHVLGQRLGYLGVRFLLLGALAVAMARLSRLSMRGALLATAVVGLSPIMHRAVFSTYTESLSVPFLLIGVVLLADAEPGVRGNRFRWYLGGLALGAAWNAHFATLPVAIAAMLAVFADSLLSSRPRQLLRRCADLAAAAAGTLTVVAAGILVYGGRFGVWDVYGPTLDFARQPSNRVYLETHDNWYSWRHYLLVIPIALVAGLVARRSTDDVALRASVRRLIWIVVVALLVFGVPEVLRSGATLSVYYYSSFPLALALLLLARSVAILFSGRAVGAGSLSALLLFGGLLAAYAVFDRLHPAYIVVVLLVAGAAAGAWALVRQAALVPAVLAALVIVAAFATVTSPHDFPAATPSFRADPRYDATLFRYDWSGADLYGVASDFAKALPSLPGERGEIRVWFDSDPASVANQVQATMLLYTSALQTPADPPPPNLSTFTRARLAIDKPRFVVVLDTSEADVTAGAQAILDEGQGYRVVWSRHFRRGAVTVDADLLERADGSWRDYPCRVDGREGSICP